MSVMKQHGDRKKQWRDHPSNTLDVYASLLATYTFHIDAQLC